ncbi:MAG: hypothetical protein JSV66_12720 [Trueperaceae bacterium]|nr:MAG: hypothetical protein JSV66_12720 [Trueperaceae bacterium]
MKRWLLENDKVRVGVTEEGGHLGPVAFRTERGEIAPMHVAPWAGETLSPDIPPILQILQGDFFCAPFSDSDLIPDEDRPHGTTANDRWREVAIRDDRLTLELAKRVMGAMVQKHLHIRPGECMVYQQHDFIGGDGALPVGHHAMLRVPETVTLSFSKWLFGATPPAPVETPPAGRSLLGYPQRFEDLAHVELADGSVADMSRYPTLERHEDLLMVIADPSLPFAWSAVTAPEHGWVWFSLKSPRTLRGTMLWLSHGGRDYPPFSGRHTHVLGVEEVTSYFHLGHRASVEANAFSDRGVPTALTLSPDQTLSIRYAFGLVTIPPQFESVKAIEAHPGGVLLRGNQGLEVFTPCDLGFITG